MWIVSHKQESDMNYLALIKILFLGYLKDWPLTLTLLVG